MAFAIINHYLQHPDERPDEEGKARMSQPHRTIPQAMRAGQLVERASGGAIRFVGMEGVDVEPHLIG